ncbi:MAG: peptidoglycan-binding domain-containing protein [Acidimicrobiales bacterium]
MSWPWILAGAAGAYLLLRKKAPAPARTGLAQVSAPATPATACAPALPNVGTSSYSAACWTKDVQNASDLVTAWHAAVTSGQDTTALKARLEAPISALEIQRDLNFLGATPALAEDGIVGPETSQAIKDFQTLNGLIPDGVVGPETAYAIRFTLGEHVNAAAHTEGT